MRNRRRFARYRSLVEVKYKSPDGVAAGYSFTKDLSKGGAGLPLDKYISPHKRLILEIDLPASGEKIIAEGVIMWCRKNTAHWGPLYIAGLKFEKIDPVYLEQLVKFASTHEWEKTEFERALEGNNVPIIN